MTALFAALLDDAALFPPGDAPMPAAVRAHRELRRDLARYTGPFVVPAARLDGQEELTRRTGSAPGRAREKAPG